MKNSLQWRFRRESQGTRCPWISSSRGRRASSSPYLELLLLVAPRFEFRSTPALSFARPSLRGLTLYFSSSFQTHLPGFVQQAGDLKSKGIEEVACVSVNDAFVMAAWGKEHGTDGKVGNRLVVV